MAVNPFDADLEPAQHEAWVTAYYNQSKFNFTPKRRGKRAKLIATIDCETDPFSGPGNPVSPFCWGFYDGSSYHSFWGENATIDLVAHIRGLEQPHIIYAHNGGKFDFTFLLNDIDGREPFVIGTRIVRATIGDHELRDSFSIIPEALDFASEKTKIDYSVMSVDRRDEHQREILDYLRDDCVLLYKYVEAFRNEFGNVLTMASASMRKLNLSMAEKTNRRVCYDRLSEARDAELRPYYYGGHVECFQRGVFNDGPYTLYDINSSYANVMRNFLHPTSAGYVKGLHSITDQTDFALVDATSKGALPIRNQITKELLFPHGRYLFQATGHELRAGIELGLVHVHKLHDAWEAVERLSFAEFIDYYYNIRLEAKARGDHIYSLFWKRVMNGAYGKFAQNPRKFTDTMICHPGDDEPDGDWQLSQRYKKLDIYTRPSDPKKTWRSYLNVGTGASITGAARAELLRGIHGATGVLYCDTDSVVAKSFSGLSDPQKLGAWKIEVIADELAIADKKVYAMWHQGECVKLASKGVKATDLDVRNLALGNTVQFIPEAPTFKLDGSQIWTSRILKRRDFATHAEHLLSQNSLQFAAD